MERERLPTDCSSSTDSVDCYTITAQARMWVRAMQASGSEAGKDISWTWESQNGKNLNERADGGHLRWEGQHW